MAIPDAVRQADKDSDAALEELEQQVEEYDQSDEFETFEQTPESGEEPEEVTEAVETEPEPEPEPEQSKVDYEQQYRSLQGKYDAEVPRLHNLLAQVQGRVEAMEQVKAQQETPEKSEPVDITDSSKRYLKSDEIDDYGREVLEIQSRMAQGVAEAVFDGKSSKSTTDIESRIAVLENQSMTMSTSTFWQNVEQAYPNARQINDSDSEWAKFLGQTDSLSGTSYRELGESAISSGDAGRIVELLKLYKPLSQKSEPSAPAAKPRAAKGRVVSSNNASAKKFLKESTIEKFYNDVARGRYSGQDEEIAKRESEIHSAYEENRVRPG